MSLFGIFNRKTCSRKQERSGLGLVRWNPSGPAILELAVDNHLKAAVLVPEEIVI